MKKTINAMRIINIVCAVLMLGLLVCQFVPFWSMDGQEVSIGGYAWFPTDHEDFTAYFQQSLSNPNLNAGNVALINTIVMLAGVVGLIFCLKNSEDVWPAAFPAVCGITVIIGYVARPVFRMGVMWQLHLVLAIMMLAMAVLCFVYWLTKGRYQE